MAYNLWDDDETLTAPAPTTAKPAPVEPAAPKRSGYNLWDDEPAAPASAAVPKTTPPAEKGYGDTLWDAVKIGVASNPDAAASFADWLGDDDDTDPTSIKNRAAAFMRDAAKTVKGGAKLQVEGVQDIGSVSDAITFALESVGQGVGSSVPSIAGGLSGAAIGSAAGPVGTAVGGILGATGPSMVTGIGGTYDALRNDPELAKKLLDKEVTQAQLKTYAGIGGAMIGSLDAFGVAKIGDIIGIKGLTKEIAEETIKKTVLKAAKEGMLAEGGTEAAQQLIQSAFTAIAGGSADLGQAALDAVNAGIAGGLGGGAMAGAGRAATKPFDKATAERETPESVDQETRDAPGASTPGGMGEPPPQPSVSGPGADPGTIRVVEPNAVDPDHAAAAAGLPVAPSQQTPTVTSVAEPTRVPAEERTAADWKGNPAPNVSRETLAEVEDEEGVYDETLYGDLPELAKEMTIRPKSRAEQEEIQVAAPRDAEVAALTAGPPEPVGTGQSPPRKPVTVGPSPGTAPPAGGPPPGAVQPSTTALEENPPAPLQVGPGVGVTPAAAVPSAGAAPGVPAGAPASIGAAAQGVPAGGEPVARVPETREPSAAEAGMAQGLLAPPAEALGGVRPAPDIATVPPDVQPAALTNVEGLPQASEEVQPAAAPAAVVTSPAAEAALPRRASDAAGQLRDIVRTSLDEDQYPVEHIDAVTDEVIRGITPRLAEHTGSVGEMVREFQDEALATARRRLPALAEETERGALEREAEAGRAAREAAVEKRATGRPQERARTTQEGTKPVADIEREGPADKRPFLRRAEKAVKQQGEAAPAYYRKGLAAQKAIGKGKATGEKLTAREQAQAELKQARAEEIAHRKEIEAAEAEAERTRAEPEKEQGSAAITPDERKKQTAKRKKIRARAGLNKKVEPQLHDAIREMPLPPVQDMGQPGWVKQLRAAINDLYKRFTPRNDDGSVATKMSPLYPPERNFLIYAKNNMKTEDGLIDVFTAKTFIDQGRMVDAANLMREDDVSAGIGTTGLGETGAWDADEGAFSEADTNEWGLAEHESVFALEGDQTFTTYDETGKAVQTPLAKSQVSDVGTELKSLAAASPDELSAILGESVPKALRKKFVERLSALVGNVPVYKISRAEMMRAIPEDQRHKIRNPAGLYVRPSDEALANGDPGYILVNTDQNVLTPLHVMMHEATHAATVAAISNDWNGTRKIFVRMYRWAQKANPTSKEYGLAHTDLGSGLYEFVAEAFSNLGFQELLARTVLPETLSKDIKAISASGKPTAWDMFVASVAHGLRMLGFGKKGMSMIEGVVRMAPTIMLSTHEQSARMAEKLDGDLERQLNALDEPRGAADPLPLMHAVRGSHEAVRQRATDVGGAARRKHLSWLETTAGIMRRSGQYFGGEDNWLSRAGEALLKREAAARLHRVAGDKVFDEIAPFVKSNPVEAQEMFDVLSESSVAGIDPRLDVAGNVAKKNVSKAGTTDAWKREAIAQQHAAWNKLSASAKAAATKLIGFYAQANTDTANLQIETTAKRIVDSGVTLPKGVGLPELIAWVKSKAIHRETGHAVRPRTQADEDLHKALGGSAETLAALEKSLNRQGVYVPLMREGNWVVTAREKVDVPAGATIADATLMPNAKHRDHMLVFKDKKAVEAYQKKAVRDGIQISAVDSIWVNDKTGKRQIKQEPDSEQRYVVHVQNKIVEFHDSYSEAQAREKELRAAGHTVNAAQQRETFMASGINDVAPAHVTRLRNALRQQQGENQPLANFMDSQLALAALRTQSGNRARHRNLKRHGVKGYNRDALQSLIDYNSSHSHFMAGLKEGSAFWDAIDKARDYAEAHRTDVGGEPQRRIEMITELEKRATNNNWMDNTGEGLIRQLTNWSAIVHLASPAYSLINSMQPAMTTMPMLSAKYGTGNVVKEMGKAYARIGYFRTWARGAKATGKAMTQVWRQRAPIFNPHAELVSKFAGDKDGALLGQAFDQARDMGLLDGAGIEQQLNEYGKSRASNFINRVSLIARTMPQYIEMMNRGVTLVASIRAQKSLDPTLSDATALRRAMHDLEETQFGYGAANMPTALSSKAGAALFQFKKYGISMGNAVGKNMIAALGPDTKSPERKRAIKTLIGLTIMGVVMAGTAGVPGVELPKTIAMLLNLALGTGDWDDAESWMQTALARMVGTSSAEAIVRGMPRLINMDIRSRVGYDSMYLFGEPKKPDEANTKMWLFDTLAGPAFGMASSLFKALHSGDWGKAPLPKLATDTIKAYQKYRTGDFTGTEAATRVFGIQPGSASAKYETGAKQIGISKSKEKKAGQQQRLDVMNAWLNIPPGPRRNEARRRAMDDIKAYNKTVPRKEHIDRGDLARAEQRRKKEERKNLREAKAA